MVVEDRIIVAGETMTRSEYLTVFGDDALMKSAGTIIAGSRHLFGTGRRRFGSGGVDWR